MSAPLRVGMVGAGYIAAVHSAAYRAVSGTFADAARDVALTAVADTDHARGAALKQAWGWQRLEDDWTSITRADDIDVVDVAVPNALHAEIAIDALKHGKHVVCEKPLADELDSAHAMVDAAESSDRLAQVCFYYRLWPAIQWASALIRSGELGAVQHFRGWMLQDYAADPQHGMGWRGTRSSAGAGALGDLGSHVIDIARYLCGEVAAVNAVTKKLVNRTEGATELDDAATMLVEFGGGATGVLEASWAMRGHKCDLGFDLVAERGAVRFTWERCNEIEVLSGDMDDQSNGFRRVLLGVDQPDGGRFAGVPGQGLGYRDAFTIGIGHAATAIATGAAETTPSFLDGLRVAQVTQAALQSAERRSWTTVPS
jgi:predicted dehydrogenase